MEHKIINTGDYLLIVDDSGSFKKESPYWLNYTNTICPNRDFGNTWMVGLRDIIAHLPLNNSPILGVSLLPPLEDEVEKLARDFYYSQKKTPSYAAAMSKGFKQGYNKSKDKYKYTEEDLIKLLEWVKTDDYRYFSRTGTSQELLGQVIQSLKQPKMPVGFKCEMYFTFTREKDYSITYEEHDKTPKTITNSLGQIVWVGEYVF